MSKSRDNEELQYYWEQWREQTGEKMVDLYKQYIDLYNEAAELNGFRWSCMIHLAISNSNWHCSDAGKMKVNSFESDTFMQEMETTWQGLKPLYEQVTK